LAQLCAAKTAKVIDNGKDRYGRTIGRVICEGVDANTEQVRRGMAWVFVKYAPKNSPLFAIEAEARGKHVGLWGDAHPIAPWEWRAKKRIGETGAKF
jgi:endonuclease YncB( thermonuclease family)